MDKAGVRGVCMRVFPDLECSLCGNQLTNPKILTCSHAYCNDCLVRLFRSHVNSDELICSTCGQSARVRGREKPKPKPKPGPKPMPKPKNPLKSTDAEGRPVRKLCGLCDPTLLSAGSSLCRVCGTFMCAACAENHEQTTDHDVKWFFTKYTKSLGAVDMAQWKERLQRQNRVTNGNTSKRQVNGANNNTTTSKTLMTSRNTMTRGISFPPSESTDGNWRLEIAKTFQLPGREAWCVNSYEEGSIAVGYMDGGVGIFDISGPRKTILEHINVQGFGSLSGGRYVIRDDENRIKIFYSDGRRAPVVFYTNTDGGFGGLGVDALDNIYIGHWRNGRIDVLRPFGGEVVREITCNGYEPWDICPLKCSNMILVSGGSMVGVLDETGRLKHEISHGGEDAYPAVLRDDSVLIAWHKEGVLNIDLYSKQLKHERSVLVGFPVNNEVSKKCCLRELPSGEIALSDYDSLTIFRRIVPSVR